MLKCNMYFWNDREYRILLNIIQGKIWFTCIVQQCSGFWFDSLRENSIWIKLVTEYLVITDYGHGHGHGRKCI